VLDILRGSGRLQSSHPYGRVIKYFAGNGDVRVGHGAWERCPDRDPDPDSRDWPYKRTIAHRANAHGEVDGYLVKWVGHWWAPWWMPKDYLNTTSREAYDREHGIVHQDQDQVERDEHDEEE
jgi:hypothetical protein